MPGHPQEEASASFQIPLLKDECLIPRKVKCSAFASQLVSNEGDSEKEESRQKALRLMGNWGLDGIPKCDGGRGSWANPEGGNSLDLCRNVFGE